jgi:hypothetical protein
MRYLTPIPTAAHRVPLTGCVGSCSLRYEMDLMYCSLYWKTLGSTVPFKCIAVGSQQHTVHPAGLLIREFAYRNWGVGGYVKRVQQPPSHLSFLIF